MNKLKVFALFSLFVFVSFSTIFAQHIDDEHSFIYGTEYNNLGVQSGDNSENRDNSKSVIRNTISSITFNMPLPFDYNKYDYTYDGSVVLELGSLFHFGGKAGMSLSAEVGYNISIVGYDDRPAIAVNSVIVGAMQKINISKIAFGIGGGLKIPFMAVSLKGIYDDDSFRFSAKKLDEDIDLTPYIKAVVDYSLFVDTKTAIILGINGVYNFDVGYNRLKAGQKGYYFGAHVGFKFAPRL